MRDSFAQYDLHQNLNKPVQTNVPKAWFEDPYALLDSLGIGFKEVPSPVTYDTLRLMAERDSIASAIHTTIKKMVANFTKRPKNKYDVGFKVVHKRKKPEKYDDGIRNRCFELEEFVLRCGQDKNARRDNMRNFLMKIVSDRLTYDQINMELVHRLDGKLHSFWHVPAYTCRLAMPKSRKGTPPPVQQQNSEAQYVQIIDNVIVSAWTENKFIWDVANPRTTLLGRGYGFSELEKLILTITSHLWGEEWNRNAFSQGSSIKGLFNFKGNISKEKLEDFRRQWLMQAAGVWNAHRQVFVNTEGIDFVPLNLNNGEMGYYQWMNYLAMLMCAEYSIAPEVVGLDLKLGAAGGAGSSIVNINESALQSSQDKFLRPLLMQIADILNGDKMLGMVDDDYCFEWYGIDQKSEQDEIQLRIQELQNFKTLNEIRTQEGLKEVDDGDVPLNPTYIGYLMQKQMAEQGQPGGGEEQEPMAPPDAKNPPAFAPPQGGDQGGTPRGSGDSVKDMQFKRMMQGLMKQNDAKQGQSQMEKSLIGVPGNPSMSYYIDERNLIRYIPNSFDIF